MSRVSIINTENILIDNLIMLFSFSKDIHKVTAVLTVILFVLFTMTPFLISVPLTFLLLHVVFNSYEDYLIYEFKRNQRSSK